MVDGLERLRAHMLQQLVDHLHVVRLGEEIGDGLGHGRPDALDIVELGDRPPLPGHRAAAIMASRKASARAVASRQEPRGDLADMADAEGIDEAVEPNVAARLDGREQLLGGGRAPTLALLELGGGAAIAGLKGEDVRRRLDQALVVERLDVLLAEALDVEGVARDEMLEALDPLGRADQAAGAAPHGIDLAGDAD